MLLKKLNLLNFRNYQEIELNFCNTVNCFSGLNGSGKTNILEAIHYLAMTKGYFSGTDSQNIRYNTSMSMVQGVFEHNDNQADTVLCTLKHGQKKQFTVNKNEYQRLGEHIGKYPVVVIAPIDQIIISGGSEIRRRFIDSIISQADPNYLFSLISYNQALLQRNSLLKKCHQSGLVDKLSFDIWNERLFDLGTPIFEKRKLFIADFQKMFLEHYRFISDNSEEVDIQYNSSLHQDKLSNLLESSFDKDLELKYTTVGIHKDDLDIVLNGFPVKKYASQGQQKSVIIALKLAQFSYLQQQGFKKPMVLLDDIFDKLDDNRVERLMELVAKDQFGQLFVTDTNESKLNQVFRNVGIDTRVFNVNNGIVNEPNPQIA